MPTYEVLDRFWADFSLLTPGQCKAFLRARSRLVHDLDSGMHIRSGLRIHELEGQPGIFSMTWARDGRATFSFGSERVPGKRHIVWRRIGTHAIYEEP